jgi:flagellar biogenesis protein FliO
VLTALGLIGMVLFIVAVIALAAAVTWVVVKLTPTRDKAKGEAAV